MVHGLPQGVYPHSGHKPEHRIRQTHANSHGPT